MGVLVPFVHRRGEGLSDADPAVRFGDGGRVFFRLQDRGYKGAVECRDAFNGLLLWRTPPREGVGNFMADISVSAAGPKNVSLSSLTVAGWLDGSTITSNTIIGSIKVGGMRDSEILSGVNNGVVGLPNPSQDFNSQATFAAIKSVTISGAVRDATFSTLNDVIAAPVITHVTFSYAKFDNAGTDWGIAMNAEPTPKQITYVDATGKHAYPLTGISLLDMEFLSRP